MINFRSIDDHSGTAFSSFNGHIVFNLSEVSDIFASGFSSGFEGVFSFFTHDLLAEGPVHKGITHSSGSGQDNLSALEDGASTSDGTTFSRVSHGGDGVHRDDSLSKVGNQGQVFSNSEGISQSGGDFLAIDSPVEEVVAIVRSSRHGNLITKVVRTIGDSSFTTFTSFHSDVVLDHLEVGNKVSVASHLEGVLGLSADHFFTKHPVDKCPALVRGSDNGQFSAKVGVSIKDIDITTFNRISFNTDLIEVHIEDSGDFHVVFDGEGKGFTFIFLFTDQPIAKVITFSRSNRQGNLITEVIRTIEAHADFTTLNGFDIDDERVFQLSKVSHNLDITVHGVRHRDFLAVHREVDEFITNVRSSNHIDLSAIVVRSFLNDLSGTSSFVGNNGHVVLNLVEVGNNLNIGIHDDRHFDLFAVHGEVNKFITFVGSGNQSNFGTFCIEASAFNSTSTFWIHSHRNHELIRRQQLEESNHLNVFGDGEFVRIGFDIVLTFNAEV